MKRPHPHGFGGLLRVSAALLAAGSLACSISQSSKSLSESSSSPFRSSSGSSQSDEASFADDVESYTKTYATSGGTAENFAAGMRDLALQRGISDWESHPYVWESIGRGLGRSGLSRAEITAYSAAWTGGDSARVAAVERGIGAVN